MKYLKIHKLLFAIFVLAFTLCEIFLFGIVWVLYIVWNFKIPHAMWQNFHNGESEWNGHRYEDTSILATIKRRYNTFN